MLTARPILEASGLPLRRFIAAVRASSLTVKAALDTPITVTQADRWCCRIGRHPVEVYGTEVWLRALEEVRSAARSR